MCLWLWNENGLLEFSTVLHSRLGPAKECREDSRRGIEGDVMSTKRNARDATVKYVREKSQMRCVEWCEEVLHHEPLAYFIK